MPNELVFIALYDPERAFAEAFRGPLHYKLQRLTDAPANKR